MTKEQINVACAEILGWRQRIFAMNGPNDPPDRYGLKDKVYNWPHELPNFYNSLDACAILVPFIKNRAEWGKIAQDVVNCHIVGYCEGDYHDDLKKVTELCNMTSQQKCEVFLKLHGRWIE